MNPSAPLAPVATTAVAERPSFRVVPLVSFEEKRQLAVSIANSGLFGIKTADQALTLMALCEAEGMHPAIAIRDYHIIQGKPALKADAMLARFQNSGGRVRWIDMTDEKVSAEFTHPAGGAVTIDWDKARATLAGFWGKDNWKKFPRAMLRARVISEGIRTVFPGVVAGTYTPEEVADFEEPRQPKPLRRVEPPPPDVVPEPSDELLHKLHDAAAFGEDTFKNAWQKLSKEERKSIGETRKEDLKKLAKQNSERLANEYLGPASDEDSNNE